MVFYNRDDTADRVDRDKIPPIRQGVKIAPQTALLIVTTHNLYLVSSQLYYVAKCKRSKQMRKAGDHTKNMRYSQIMSHTTSIFIIRLLYDINVVSREEALN